MLDGDTERFEAGLNQTGAGLRLRLAMHEGNIALQQLRRLKEKALIDRRSAVESWRKAYIAACNRASMAIDELFDAHQWPEDGARNRRFEWRPTKNFRR